MKRTLPTAVVGWAAVFATVTVYDAWAILKGHETLSSAFRRARAHKKVRILVVGGWGALTWHLVAGDQIVLPERLHAHYVRFHPIWSVTNRLTATGESSRAAISKAQGPTPVRHKFLR